MPHEEEIRSELIKTFGLPEDSIRVARERRVFVTVPYEKFRAVIEHARRKMDFPILCTISGQDEGDCLSAMYHCARMDGTILSIKTFVPKTAPEIGTVSDIYPGGVSYERELCDLLGFKVAGLPPGKRYPLPDGWPEGQYPLRKDWKAEYLGDAEIGKGM